MLPFSREEFLDVFGRYHEAMWFAVWFFYVGAIAALITIFRVTDRRLAFRVAMLYLGGAWLWMGIVYHWEFFRPINPAAGVFAVAFVVQSGFLLKQAVWPGPENFGKPNEVPRILAAVLALYSLVIYPLLGFLTGHGYPRGPSFELPCPTTIFTFALLLFVVSDLRTFLRLAMIPFVWSIIGTFAAVNLGIYEDWALLPSAILAVGAMIWIKYRKST